MLSWIAEKFGAKNFKIFISHSFDDNEWIDDYLTGVVTNLGAKYLKAEHNFLLSNQGNVSDKIAGLIDSSDAVLAILSEKGNASKFVQQEIGYAYKAKKPVIALIETQDKEIELPGFLYGKDAIKYKDMTELNNLKDYLKKIISATWDQKKNIIKGNIVFGGIVGGIFLISPFLPKTEDD